MTLKRAMGALKTAVSFMGRLFVKKVTVVDPDGEENTKTSPREGWKGLGWIVGFLILWHFVLQPVLAHHFSDYDFPALDWGWLTGLLAGF